MEYVCLECWFHITPAHAHTNCRLSSLVSVCTALHSVSQSQLSGGPVDLSHQLHHVVRNLVRNIRHSSVVGSLATLTHMQTEITGLVKLTWQFSQQI